MERMELSVGDVMQIDPEYDPVFGGCFMQVTEPKSWGAQGFVVSPSKDNMVACYRCAFKNMELVGKAEWIPE